MSEFDKTHDAPSGRWRRSPLIKIDPKDVCYGPECPGQFRYPRTRSPGVTSVIGGGVTRFSITAITPITATVGPYSSIITTVRGGTGPYTYYINTGTLPIGLTINLNTADISGTLTVASVLSSPYTFTILAIDSLGHRAVSNVVTFNVIATLWDLATWDQSNWS